MGLSLSALLVSLLSLVNALITFEDIDTLAVVTTRCFKTIGGHPHDASKTHFPNSQHVISPAGNMQDIDIITSTALSSLNSNLTAMLNVPMDVIEKYAKQPDPCFTVVKQHRALLTSTAWLLNTLDEKQQENRWTRDSQVYKSFRDTQALWASRRMNRQKLSFIEQQISLYKLTDCFAKNEVLRRGVEVVEYMNDILDSFL